jgi:hypothetical protein
LASHDRREEKLIGGRTRRWVDQQVPTGGCCVLG